MPYTTGAKTYTAYEDMPKHRIVVLRNSSTDPFEVELANQDSEHLFGVTLTAAKAGELISVRPFDNDGTFEIESAGTIAHGSRVYVYDGTGRVNDEVRVPIVGRALNSATVGQVVTVALTKDMVYTLPAEDITIEDTGDHYTSDNVEGALQEVGTSIDTIESDITTIESTLTDLQDTKTIIEWFDFDDAVSAAGGGNGSPASSRLIPILSEYADPTGADAGKLYRQDLGSGYYGATYIRNIASGSLDTRDYYMSMNIRPRHKIHTAGAISFRLYASQESTAGSTHFHHRVTARGTASSFDVTPYSIIYLSGQSSAGWHTGVSFTAGQLSFDPSSFMVFMRIESDGTTNTTSFYGLEMTYETDINDL